jgi:hypothetical protein
MENDKGQDVELREISIQRMKAKHLKLIPEEIYNIKDARKKVKTINPDKLLPLIAGLTGLTNEQIDEVDIEDLLIITDKVMVIVGEALGQTV